MDIPEIGRRSSRPGATSAATLLFERLPDRLFAPLASTNRHRYWALLCRLHEHRFGPDAPLPPSRGFGMRVITQDIEEELETQDAWDDEGGETPETPINIRALAVFARLHESGWFRVDQLGFGEKKVTMPPAVSQFLSMLVSFAETGPVFVSGKIQSIDANLKMVADGSATGDVLSEAAEQARNLLVHVRNTSTIIRDLMDSLHQGVTTAHYVQRFFSDYIERVFIGDYRELRTHDHPLSRRGQILVRIDEIHSSQEHRKRLVAWYEEKRSPGDQEKAERLFERDIFRLSELQRIDEYLDRLDDEIRRANKRAHAFLNYHLRSLRPVDHMIRLAIESLLANGDPVLNDPFAPGELIGADRLADPKKAVERAAPSPLRKTIISEEQLARAQLMLRARNARTVTAPALSAFVKTHLNGNEAINGQELKLNGVAEIRLYQSLMTIGLQMSAKGLKPRTDALLMSKGFRVIRDGNTELAHAAVSGVPFILEPRKPRTNKTEK
ncbi:MAG TPA: Wadjet anti-phage system protein JetA family protein [Halothiobacillus sp.]|nr:Wadjet anti-phage system protein JetA family protein [Halothiobacillus sp.]